MNLAKHGKVIDDKTEPGDLLVISMGGIMDVSTGGDLLALRAQLRGVQGELTGSAACAIPMTSRHLVFRHIAPELHRTRALTISRQSAWMCR
ncbi:MAG: hypothetical protein ACLTR6_12885 [Clostridium fessum]